MKLFLKSWMRRKSDRAYVSFFNMLDMNRGSYAKDTKGHGDDSQTYTYNAN